METLADILGAAWEILLDSSPYVLFGLLVSGFLHAFLDPRSIARHLGRGRIGSVVKAAALGIPLPLCSCGVLPAAVSLRDRGATRGATTAFLISTPETGADSIAVSWALLDPLLSVARPLAAFFTATAAGIAENFLGGREPDRAPAAAPAAPGGALPGGPGAAAGPVRRLGRGLSYAARELWGDLAPWFFLGVLLAGAVMGLMPEDFFARHVGSGLPAMLLLLAAGLPLYVCATASTPLAAALIVKGVSPGAALVFLLAGPATNLATITVLLATLGRRATAVYLAAIVTCSLLCGWLLDLLYEGFGLSARAEIGAMADAILPEARVSAAAVLLLLSIPPLLRLAADAGRSLARFAARRRGDPAPAAAPRCTCALGCGENAAGPAPGKPRP